MVAAAVLPVLLAFLAVIAQPTPPPADFIAGMATATARVEPETFIGLGWPCGDEECHAGLAWRHGRPSLETGT